MSRTVRDTIIGLLKEIRYHPEFSDDSVAEARKLIENLVGENEGRQIDIAKLAKLGDPKAGKIRQMMYDSLLMEDYFYARVRFLERLIGYLATVKSALRIADDGCGSGVDIYCLTHILPEMFTIFGIDPSEAALEVARARNTATTFFKSLAGQQFDLIYTDFFDVGHNLLSEVAQKGEEYVKALTSKGVLVQNVDQDDSSRRLLIGTMKGLRLRREELLSEIPNNPDCYLLVWEKSPE